MSENIQLLQQVEKLISWKKGKKWVAERMGITEQEVSDLLAESRANTLKDNSLEEITEQWTERLYEVNDDRGTLKSSVVSSFEPKTHKELAELHKVDLSKYKISSYWTKQRGDKFTSSLLCTLIKPSEFNPEKFAEYVKGYKTVFKPNKVESAKTKPVVDVEVSLADFHIDKLDINGETITDRKEQYKRVIVNLLSKITPIYNIDTIIFTIGNDYFHTDTYNGTTTKGTPLEPSETWCNAYEEGFDLMVWAITFLRSLCADMEVILVNGNHDRTKSYYLAHALATYFGPDSGIYFDRTDSPYKYTVLGSTFIGYNHGDGKIDDLPIIFATSPDSSPSFGNAKYREIRTGDKHYYLTKEIKGVRVQQLPSLAGTDKWHRDNQYVNNIRAALALVYDQEKGKIMEIEERI